MNTEIEQAKKIELHCHLDGSMDVMLTQKLAAQLDEKELKTVGLDETIRENTPENIAKLCKLMTAPPDCPSLAVYLERFSLPILCLQTKEALKAATKSLMLTAHAENVQYMEIRFAPMFHMQRGLTLREVLESAVNGVKEAERETGIQGNLIACGMRHLSVEENCKILMPVRELFGEGVCGVDLAGDEAAYPTTGFRDFFAEAKRMELPFTIHSGECGSAENIEEAIALGARRLGHGIAMATRPDLMKICADKRIGVEMCPTSNLQTKAVQDMEHYPFMNYYKAGVPVNISTDNRTVSQTSLTKDLELALEPMAEKEVVLKQIYRDSVEMSFADDAVKHSLLK